MDELKDNDDGDDVLKGGAGGMDSGAPENADDNGDNEVHENVQADGKNQDSENRYGSFW